MTTYNTGNPIGSTAVKDLYDNAENLDVLVNDKTKETHPDRFGVARKTWHGMEAEFNASQVDKQDRFNNFIASSGYHFLGDYAAGIEITEYNQIIRDTDGEFWRVSGQLELPYTTTGDWSTEGDLFVSVGDAALRQDLANPGKGAAMVAGVSHSLDCVSQIRKLRKDGNSWAVTAGYHAKGDGGNAFYYLDESDTTSIDDGGSVIVADDGGRWKLNHNGTVSVKQFGARGNGVDDDHASIQRAIDFCVGTRVILDLPKGNYIISEPLKVLSVNYAQTIIMRGAGAGNGGTRITKMNDTKATGIPVISAHGEEFNPNVDAILIIAPSNGEGEVKYADFSGLLLVGNSPGQSNKFGIYMPFGSKCNFLDVRTFETGSAGFWTYNLWNCVFTRCIWEYAKNGFVQAEFPSGGRIGGTSLVFNSCGVVNFTSSGFYFSSLYYSVFNGCFVENQQNVESPRDGWWFNGGAGITLVSPGTENTLFRRSIFGAASAALTVINSSGYSVQNAPEMNDTAIYYATQGARIGVIDHGIKLTPTLPDGIRPVIAVAGGEVNFQSSRYTVESITGRTPLVDSTSSLNMNQLSDYKNLSGIVQSEFLGTPHDLTYGDRSPGRAISGIKPVGSIPVEILKIRHPHLVARQVFAVDVDGLMTSISGNGCRAVDVFLITLAGLDTPTIEASRQYSHVLNDKGGAEYVLTITHEVVNGEMEFSILATTTGGVTGNLRVNALIHSVSAIPIPV